MTRGVALLAGWLLAAACGPRDGGATRGGGRADPAAAADTLPAGASADSTIFGDDRAGPGGAARRVPEVALLEGLIDEYEALDVVQDGLARARGGSPVTGHAWKGDRHEDAAKERLAALLAAAFHEHYQPRTPDGSAAVVDSLARLPGAAGKRALDGVVLAHHRRVAAAITAAMPSLTNPRVREVTHQLEEGLRKELAKLERSGG